MSAFVRVFQDILHNAASAGDFVAAVRAPLVTDGAPISPNALDKKATALLKALRKPAASVDDIVSEITKPNPSAKGFYQPAVLDAIEHSKGVGIDDRLLLLEDALVLMSRLSAESGLSAKVQQYVISLLYNDLPHPPRSYVSLYNASIPPVTTSPATKDGLSVSYAFRSADGSHYNSLSPSLGMAGSPYARSVLPKQIVPKQGLPDPGEVFDQILRRKEFVPHPGGISSLFFAFADLVIHSIFDTDHHDPTINRTSSYLDLSILYGNSESDVDQVRRKDGSGKLWDDVFSDARLLLMPPASCALLVLMNRNHNYIAEKLLDINENGNFSKSPNLSDEDRRIQDDEIFHRTRLINCGFFMNIILGDYVGAILGLVTDGSSWRLDPLMDMRESDHSVSPRGEGNVVSVEFNLLYRWHATLSTQDAEWTEKEFKAFFGDKDLDKVTPQDFINVAHIALIPEPDVKKRTFGGLKREQNGRFKDDDLARIIQDATEWRAAAYSSGCPEALRVIEILGIEQSRSWGTCSLNEFRKFLGLKPYKTFAEWNPDPRIYTAAEALYNNDIETLELHVGLQAEECKKPGPGAGLCPGYTISRAILADAVCLTRGDPYLTNEFNTDSFTQWGYNDCQYDKHDGSYGGLLTKLLFRTLPNNYPVGSAYAHFPFLVPGYIQEKNPEVISKYKWERPPATTSAPVPVSTYAGATQVLESSSFLSVYDSRFLNLATTDVKDLSAPLAKGRETVENLISSTHNSNGTWAEYFRRETEDLIRDKSYKNYDNSSTVDIVRDVINLLPIHWVAEKVLGLPLKTESNPRGVIYEQDAYKDFSALGRYVFSNVDNADDWHLHLDSVKAFSQLFKHVKGRFDQTLDTLSISTLVQDAVDAIAVESSKDSLHFVARVIAAFKGQSETVPPTTSALSVYTIDAVIPTAVHFSQAIAQIVDFYLDENKKQERAKIVELSASITQDRKNVDKIMPYVYKALRANPPVTGVYRTAGADIPVPGSRTIKSGERVLVDLRDANLDDQNPYLLWNEDGLLSPSFFESTVPVILGTILGLNNIRRTAGNPGHLSRFEEDWDGITRQLYIDEKGKVTPFAPALKIDFDKSS